MSRVKRGTTSKARHKKIIKLAKGYRGRAKNCFRIAIQRVEKGLQYAYRDRKNKKRDFRALWVQRINAAVREKGLKYSQFINGIKLAKINLNRKMLSELAIHNSETFSDILNKVKKTLESNIEKPIKQDINIS